MVPVRLLLLLQVDNLLKHKPLWVVFNFLGLVPLLLHVLLASMLFFDRDDRFRTLLDTAVKLDGDLAHYRAFLDAAPITEKTAIAPTPDEIDALTGFEKAPAPEPAPEPLPESSPAPLKIPAKPSPPAPLLLPPTLPPVPMP